MAPNTAIKDPEARVAAPVTGITELVDVVDEVEVGTAAVVALLDALPAAVPPTAGAVAAAAAEVAATEVATAEETVPDETADPEPVAEESELEEVRDPDAKDLDREADEDADPDADPDSEDLVVVANLEADEDEPDLEEEDGFEDEEDEDDDMSLQERSYFGLVLDMESTMPKLGLAEVSSRMYHHVLTSPRRGQATWSQYVFALATDATASPDLAPEVGHPDSVIQTGLPSLAALVLARASSKRLLALSMLLASVLW